MVSQNFKTIFFSAIATFTTFCLFASDRPELNLTLHTGNPISVAEIGKEDEMRIEVGLPKGASQSAFILQLTITDYRGRNTEWKSDVLTVSGEDSTEVPLANIIPGIGWWKISPRIVPADGKGKVIELQARELALIHPLDSRSLPPGDGFWFGFDSRVRTPEILRLLSKMGVDIVRYGTWAKVHPQENQFDWEDFDRVMGELEKNGMQGLYSVTFTPPWALNPEYRGKGDPSRLPPRSDALRDSLRKVITHTREKGVTVYDLWNEPDHRGFWQGNSDDYLEFVRIAYSTIKEIQPESTVLSGGIASLHQGRTDGLNPDMDKRIILQGSKWYDALSLHEHGTFSRFAEALDGPLTEYQAQQDPKRPIWFTETGHNSSGRDKASVLVKKFIYSRSHGAKGMIWYALYPPGEGGEYNVINKLGDPQPVIPAYGQMVRMMRGKRFVKGFDDPTNSGNQLFLFEGDGHQLYISWGNAATAHQARILLNGNAEGQAFDLMGRNLTLQKDGNSTLLPFASTPQYLLINGKASVGTFDVIQPLAQFAFDTFEPTEQAPGVKVSPLDSKEWARRNAKDADKRMEKSISGPPNGMFDGDAKEMGLEFTITPAANTTLKVDTLSFHGNSGAFNGVSCILTYQIAGADPITVGSKSLRNLSAPGVKGDYYEFPLSGLDVVTAPVTFRLVTSRNGERIILKIDDLRVDGVVDGSR